MASAVLADVILVVHLTYVGFVLFGFIVIPCGGPLGWPWVRRRGWRIAHLIAMVFVGFEAAIGMACPLTVWESALRTGGAQSGEIPSFVGRIAARLLYYDFPPWVFTMAYLALTAVVVALWWLVPPRKRVQ